MLCDFKRSTEAVGLGIHPSKTKILSNQMEVKKDEVTIDNIKIEVLQKKRECTVRRTKNHVRRTRDSRNQKQMGSSVGSLSQIPTGTHIKNISRVSQIATAQHGDHADTDLRQRNMGHCLRNTKK